MKKLCLMFAVVLTVLLAACGEMSQQDVVDKLTSNLEDAKSYYATGVMEVDNNGQVYQYNVEVAYQKPENYKVTLKNETTNNEQIILKPCSWPPVRNILTSAPPLSRRWPGTGPTWRILCPGRSWTM